MVSLLVILNPKSHWGYDSINNPINVEEVYHFVKTKLKHNRNRNQRADLCVLLPYQRKARERERGFFQNVTFSDSFETWFSKCSDL